jgi:hypothetical protein
MNKLWIFEVWNIASPKTWVGSTKTGIQHDIQLVYISGLLQAYFLPTHGNGEVPVLRKLPQWFLEHWRPLKSLGPRPQCPLPCKCSMFRFRCFGPPLDKASSIELLELTFNFLTLHVQASWALSPKEDALWRESRNWVERGWISSTFQAFMFVFCQLLDTVNQFFIWKKGIW